MQKEEAVFRSYFDLLETEEFKGCPARIGLRANVEGYRLLHPLHQLVIALGLCSTSRKLDYFCNQVTIFTLFHNDIIPICHESIEDKGIYKVIPWDERFIFPSCPKQYQKHLPGCVSQGESVEAAMKNIQEAIWAYVESLERDNIPVPPETKSLMVAEV